MPPRIKPVAPVLLAGADADAIAFLQPSAEVLAGFGIAVESVVVARGGEGVLPPAKACMVIVASPDGVLPAALARMTSSPVIRVPMGTTARNGLDLLTEETGDLPAGADENVFATMAIGVAGAKNAALFVVAALALADDEICAEYAEYRARQTAAVLDHSPLEL